MSDLVLVPKILLEWVGMVETMFKQAHIIRGSMGCYCEMDSGCKCDNCKLEEAMKILFGQIRQIKKDMGRKTWSE